MDVIILILVGLICIGFLLVIFARLIESKKI